MLLRHTYPVEDATVAGRILDMVMVPVDDPRHVADGDTIYREAFGPTSFAHIPASRVELRYTHQPDLLNDVGRGVDGTLRVDGRYWRASMRVVDNPRGDHLLGLYDDGMLGSVSIGFEPGIDETRSDGDGPYTLRVRVRRLDHVALVGPSQEAQYPDARVLARRATDDQQRAELMAWIASVRRGTLPE